MLEAGGGDCIDRGGVHVAFEVFVELLQLLTFEAIPEGRFGFECQAVGGDVIGIKAQCRIEIALPVGEGFAGGGEDKVEGNVDAEPVDEAYGVGDIGGLMIALQ